MHMKPQEFPFGSISLALKALFNLRNVLRATIEFASFQQQTFDCQFIRLVDFKISFFSVFKLIFQSFFMVTVEQVISWLAIG